jgi:LEA14-like dessication related protein
MRRFLLLLVVVFLCLDCSKQPLNPSIKGLKGLSIDKLDGDSLYLTALWEVNNPNSFAITIPSLEYKIYMADQFLGEGSKTQSFLLDANKTTQITTPFKLKLLNLLQIAPVLLKKDKVSYLITGKAKFSIQSYNIDLPFEQKGEMDIKPLQVWIEKKKQELIPKDLKGKLPKDLNKAGEDLIHKGKDILKGLK